MLTQCIMNTTFTEKEEKIFKLLKLQGCCMRCCLRFTGCKILKYYQNIIEFSKELQFIQTEETVESEELPCIACLGILQSTLQEKVIDRIKSEIEKQNYDCTTFTCALTIPISVCLRERLLHIYIANELDLLEKYFYTLKIKTQSIKDVWKWVIIPKIEQAIGKHAELTIPSPFLIEIFFVHTDGENECATLLEKCGENNIETEKRKRKYDNRYSRKRIESLMANTTNEQFAQHFTFSLIKSNTCVNIGNVLCSHSSIFIGGRYNKLSRELSQTPWFINGEKKMKTSVQDILCNPVAKAVNAESIKFLSSGREDVDVRNIHSGRPFAIELINPRVTNITENLLLELADEINNSSKEVRVTTDLKVLNRNDLKKLKEGENVKTKYYRALCVCRSVPQDLSCLENLNKLKNVQIVQKTPIRVLHRRPLSPRVRLIYEMRARWSKPNELNNLLNRCSIKDSMFFVLDVKTQAGTYVKEFVHGDFGRTKPSLCDLLNMDIDIVALDVTGINLNWP